MNNPTSPELSIRGEGAIKLPEGMTQEEAERRCREADNERKDD